MNERQDAALEALLTLALLDELTRDVPSLADPEPELDSADQQALDALGPDLVCRILKLGARGSKGSPDYT